MLCMMLSAGALFAIEGTGQTQNGANVRCFHLPPFLLYLFRTQLGNLVTGKEKGS